MRDLKYSDGEANRRIRAARLYLKRPEVCELLKRREVSLCTLSEILDEPEMLSLRGAEALAERRSNLLTPVYVAEQ